MKVHVSRMPYKCMSAAVWEGGMLCMGRWAGAATPPAMGAQRERARTEDETQLTHAHHVLCTASFDRHDARLRMAYRNGSNIALFPSLLLHAFPHLYRFIFPNPCFFSFFLQAAFCNSPMLCRPSPWGRTPLPQACCLLHESMHHFSTADLIFYGGRLPQTCND